jgi:hypothetical protein
MFPTWNQDKVTLGLLQGQAAAQHTDGSEFFLGLLREGRLRDA